MEKEMIYYVARDRQTGYIVAIITDNSIMFSMDKAKMVKRCIAAGFQVDRMNNKDIAELLANQKEPPDYPDDKYRDGDNEIPF